jgi:hypothetical protein
MNKMRAVCIEWNILIGLWILFIHYIYLYQGIGQYGVLGSNEKKPILNKTADWVWSPFNNGIAFYMRIGMALFATVSCITIFVGVVCISEWSGKHLNFALSNCGLMFSSALYAPLMYYAFHVKPSSNKAIQWEKSLVIVESMWISR